jgi:hypothetical protein
MILNDLPIIKARDPSRSPAGHLYNGPAAGAIVQLHKAGEKGAEMSERINVIFSSTNKNFLYNCEIPISMLPRNGERIRLSIPGHSDIRCYVEDMEWQYAELEKRIDISMVARVKILKED